jgi:hypothetical protein
MSEALVALYAPYCQGTARRAELVQALELLAAGALEGARPLRPAGSRPFRLSWRAAASPLDRSAAQLQIAGAGDQPGHDYSFDVPTYQLVLWLMDGIAGRGESTQPLDLPESFWRWLILGLDPAAMAA